MLKKEIQRHEEILNNKGNEYIRAIVILSVTYFTVI